ncbi:adenylate kinase [Morella rubra]|uniref:Adenylate kinase n=1 Tax=Morella rubra TaxID=262757 RepID=A0A6A1VWI9_9ROSI|nr:adenylate kinase [Morella rubra]
MIGLSSLSSRTAAVVTASPPFHRLVRLALSRLYSGSTSATAAEPQPLDDGYYQGEIGFILDGIPRSPIQAEILDELAEIDLVVNFKCADDFLMRDQERGTFALIFQDGTWKEKLQVYAKQVVINSHASKAMTKGPNLIELVGHDDPQAEGEPEGSVAEEEELAPALARVSSEP